MTLKQQGNESFTGNQYWNVPGKAQNLFMRGEGSSYYLSGYLIE